MKDRMLNGILKLGDIDDVEQFCQIRINSYLKKRNMKLSADDKEDLMSFAMAKVWETHHADWSEKGSFAGYASYILPMRITDYWRAKWGRDSQKLMIETAVPFSSLGDVESWSNDIERINSRMYLEQALT
jgi:DNA-directed RNA polymerase specialized sigma24 family protein